MATNGNGSQKMRAKKTIKQKKLNTTEAPRTAFFSDYYGMKPKPNPQHEKLLFLGEGAVARYECISRISPH